MTKGMLQDLIKELKKKNKILLISLIVAIVLFVGMTIFAFSSFDIVSEETTEISYDAETNGDNSSIEQTNTNETQDNSIYIICGTVIICVGFAVLGVYLYGKSKQSRKNDYKEKEENND